ncbi:MAG: hypothetical protein ACRC33_30350 [Gemmataceae bacterium]
MRTKGTRPSFLSLEDRTTPATFDLQGDTLLVNGTDADDRFTFTAGTAAHEVTLNGVSYSVDPGLISTVSFLGNGGHDSAEVTGGEGDDTALLRHREGALIGPGYLVAWADVAEVDANGAPNDYAILKDSAGDDTFLGTPAESTYYGTGFANTARGFGSVDGLSEAGGSDAAIFRDTEGDDTFTAMPNYANLHGAGYSIGASGFTSYDATASGGSDTAYFFDSSGDDSFSGYSNYAVMSAGGTTLSGSGFDAVIAEFNNNGNDAAYLYGTEGDEAFNGNELDATLTGAGFSVMVSNAKVVNADVTQGGTDAATIYDTSSDDRFEAAGPSGALIGLNLSILTLGFDSIDLKQVLGGTDTLYLLAPLDYAFTVEGFTLAGDGLTPA